MTEGGHRHVLYPKLKVAGAWKPRKAHDIAQLRFIRANGERNDFWEEQAA